MQKLMEEDFLKSSKIRQRDYSILWSAMTAKIYGGSLIEAKSNVIEAAYEGGNRLARRQENIETAFTYGKKIKYKDLDNPQFKFNIIQQYQKTQANQATCEDIFSKKSSPLRKKSPKAARRRNKILGLV